MPKSGALTHSETLRRLVERMDFNLSGFAKKCGLTPSTLSFYLLNRRPTTPYNRKRILKELKKVYSNVSWDDIFYFPDNNKNEEDIKNENK